MLPPIIPMEPKRSDIIPFGEEWVAQIKWDGVRVLTYFNGTSVRLFNRRLHERTRQYPEVTDLSSYCRARSVILDGEVIALGDDGTPSFHEVMRRDSIRNLDQVPRVQSQVPVTYMVFDVLYYNGRWIHQLPLAERMSILSDILMPTDHVQPVESHDDGVALFEAVKRYGMEGIVVKRTDSTYAIGEKKETWLKVKHYRDLLAVVGGFTLNGGIVNALLLGLYDPGGNLIYIGHAGTGKLTRAEWRSLTELLQPLTIKDCPFAHKPESVSRSSPAYWVRPIVTVRIQYMDYKEGRSLRQPSIQAFLQMDPYMCTTDQLRGE